MIFGVLLVDTSRKFRKNHRFWGKIHLPTSKNFEIHLPRRGDPPKNTPCIFVNKLKKVFALSKNRMDTENKPGSVNISESTYDQPYLAGVLRSACSSKNFAKPTNSVRSKWDVVKSKYFQRPILHYCFNCIAFAMTKN